MNEEKCVRLASARASSLLGVSRSELMTAVVSAKFPWLHDGEIVWSRTPSFEHGMFWIPDEEDEEPVLLNGKDRMSAISRVLVANVGSLPDNLSAETLAQAVRQLGEDPRGLLAGKELLKRFGDDLEVLLQTSAEPSRQVLLDANTDPVLRSVGDHGWALDFAWFTPKGGVEAWKVEGDHAAIQRMDRAALLPDHTFFWPMA
ncbi:MAG: hypothetical protein ABJE95_27955 [Byssovorax sp.]